MKLRDVGIRFDSRHHIPARRISTAPTETFGPNRGRGRLPDLAGGIRNIRMMHLLERIATKFNQSGVRLMVLKGAALNVTIYGDPCDRPMGDLDLLVNPADCDQAVHILEQLGCLRGEELVREDFFPRFHYEIEFTAGNIDPVKIDLHVRPFRPLRYSQVVPDDGLWRMAEEVRIGRATVFLPCPADMLIHLAAHSAIHGQSRLIWHRDIQLWADRFRAQIDWDDFVRKVREWQLVLPVRRGLAGAEQAVGRFVPADANRKLSKARVSWRDRLALWHAARDAVHPAGHVTVNALCTPGLRFVLSYLRAVLLPSEPHMAQWYAHRHAGWLPFSHLLRIVAPLTRRFPRIRASILRVETRRSPIHGIGVFATKEFKPGDVIGRFHGKVVEHNGQYCVFSPNKNDPRQKWAELTGRFKFLNHSCQPKAELQDDVLVALQPILRGDEITISYGPDACDCKSRIHPPSPLAKEASLSRVA